MEYGKSADPVAPRFVSYMIPQTAKIVKTFFDISKKCPQEIQHFVTNSQGVFTEIA
jgi:hypothetical protein